MEEIWKDVEGYNGKYQVSNLGRVRKVEILKQFIHNRGYIYSNLDCKHKYIHRLVAEAFLENSNNLPTVNHIDENKENNTLSNLEWCSYKDNNIHGTAITRRVSSRSKAVLQYDLEGNLIKEWKSAKEVERILGYSNVGISQCCRGLLKKSKGYIWRFKN